MASSISVTLQYQKSSTATGNVNVATLNQEISAVGVSQTLTNLQLSGTVIFLEFSGILDGADITLIDGVISAHTGEIFQNVHQRNSAAEDLNGQVPIEVLDDNWVDVLTHSSGALPKGSYQILWAAEHRVDAESDDDDSEVRALYDVGGGTFVEISTDTNQSSKFRAYSNGIVFHLVDGQNINMKMQARKTGVGSAKTIVRRIRLSQRLVLDTQSS